MLSLHDREWKEFFLRDVFPEIKRGKRLKTADHIDGNIPYVSSSAVNNGVDAFIGNGGKVRKFRDCVTLANSGSVGKAFFHPYEFIASDHVTALKTSLDKGIQGKEAKKVLPTLHKTPPNGTIGGVFVCGGKSLNPGPRGYAAPIVTRRYLQAWQTKPRPTPRRKRRAALPLPRRSRRNKR